LTILGTERIGDYLANEFDLVGIQVITIARALSAARAAIREQQIMIIIPLLAEFGLDNSKVLSLYDKY
jgi:hypothetical protein